MAPIWTAITDVVSKTFKLVSWHARNSGSSNNGITFVLPIIIS